MILSTHIKRILSVVTLAICVAAPAAAQQDSITSLKAKIERFKENELQEKIFAHIDRTFYLTGETMWFKLYYTDASLHRPLNISKIGYVEVLDKDNKAVLQTKIGLSKGGGHGSLFLPASLAAGNYTVRAYTSWMKNFSPDLYFQQAITIVNPFTKLGLTVLKEPKFDIQFFPEGGDMIAGVRSRVAFRATDVYGKGISFVGRLVSSEGDTVLRFSPSGKGIGNFSFVPAAGQTYTAIINPMGYRDISVALPAVKNEGYSISAADSTNGSLMVHVYATKGALLPNAPFCYLLTHTRELNVKTRIIYLQGGRGSIAIDKNSLLDGVSHLTLFTSALQPVCDRLYFKFPAVMGVSVKPDQPSYSVRKKVSLDISIPSDQVKAGADFSVAVFKEDSLHRDAAPDINTWMLLTSELKGTVESAGEYLKSDTPESKAAIDNIMLTHGWSRFSWNDVLKNRPVRHEFTPEYRGHIINGKIKGIDPASGRRVVAYLSNPDKNIRLYPSRSTADGKVQFELREFFGSRKLIAQMNTQVDSIYDIEILSPFSNKMSGYVYPRFDFPEALAAQTAERSIHMQVQNTFHDQTTDKFVIASVDTTAFYGYPDERYFLDDYTRFPTMEEVLREYVAGVRVRKRGGKFHFITMDNLNKKIFRDNPLVLLDGVPVFDIDKIMALDPRKVKKLDVMTRKYYLGPLSFEGIVSYTTYQGDLSDFQLDRRAVIADYEGLQIYREFYSPRYDTDEQRTNRIPDMRNLVYWNPDLTTMNGSVKCEFYTSDVTGNYKVIVNGLNRDGKTGSASTTIVVKGRNGL